MSVSQRIVQVAIYLNLVGSVLTFALGHHPYWQTVVVAFGMGWLIFSDATSRTQPKAAAQGEEPIPKRPTRPMSAEGSDGKPWAVLSPVKNDTLNLCPYCSVIGGEKDEKTVLQSDLTKPHKGPSWPKATWAVLRKAAAPSHEDAAAERFLTERPWWPKPEEVEIETYRKATIVRVREDEFHEALLMMQKCGSCGAGWYRLPMDAKAVEHLEKSA